jgi:hypothetical protein
MSWIGQLVCIVEIKITFKILIRNPEGNKPFGRPGYR